MILSERVFRLCLRRQYVEFRKPLIMGIINLSQDSFFRSFSSIDEVLNAAEAMVTAGAELIDIGGEATNPAIKNTDPQLTALQNQRVLEAIKQIRARFSVYISVDTSDPFLMRQAIDAGVDLINDQRALQVPGAKKIIAESEVMVCLMHGLINPRQPGSTTKEDMLKAIDQDFKNWVSGCETAGIEKKRIILDPGFGGGHYGKNTEENFYLLSQLKSLQDLDLPLLVGISRKSMIGDVLQTGPNDRLYGSLAAEYYAALQGAAIIRTHDVKPLADMRAVMNAIGPLK